MAFKINVSDKGKTLKLESDNETLIRMRIGEKLDGGIISPDLAGYELEITGTSDIAGFPGLARETGPHLRKILRIKGEKGNRTTRPKGIRLKKSVRGDEISDKTSQINTIVIKEGSKKFTEMLPKKEAKEEKKEEPKAA